MLECASSISSYPHHAHCFQACFINVCVRFSTIFRCFFSIELPPYGHENVMHERLLYAINHCVAIDADSTDAAQAAARAGGPGFDDDDDF